MHGAGNDYVYVDARGKDAEWPAVSVAISDGTPALAPPA